MNQARSGPYYAEDFAVKRPIPWMALFAAVVAVAILCFASALYGYRDGHAHGRAFQADLATPTCAAPPAPIELSRSECVTACFSKDRMSRVKPGRG